jgi:hypothetical protein
MNVVFANPISISLDSAKLVVEDGTVGTIEFTLFDQPVRLIIDSTEYSYDIDIAINDRVSLTEQFGALGPGSKGIVQQIIPDYTEDRAKVLFDEVYPDQILNPVEAHINTAITSLLIEVPLRLLEKV